MMQSDPEREDQKSRNRSRGTAAQQRGRATTPEAQEDQPRYVISVAAQILGVHPQTLRLYEREGLVEPKRTGGKIRLYSEHDIDRVRRIMRLTNDLGVNLAGAEAILFMRERMMEMYREMEKIRREMEAELAELRHELDID